jgi:GTP-binding protein Era
VQPENNDSAKPEASAAKLRSGYVAIVGRPNVGKSTLLNRILGQKIAITSPKPQTTRHRILGIKTTPTAQTIYLDTPGLHLGGKRAMNRYLNRTAAGAIGDVDVVVFMVEGLRWTEEDEAVLERLREARQPVVLVVNKVDRLRDKTALLPHLQGLAERMAFAHIVPLSARKGSNLARLEQCLVELLPSVGHFFPEDQITDRSERFLAAELVREKLMLVLQQELPYALTVEIERFEEAPDGRRRIGAIIWVERPGQKRIVIGKDGAVLKEVGRRARLDMERLFDARVFLELWVKVKEGWSDDDRALRSLGYDAE